MDNQDAETCPGVPDDLLREIARQGEVRLEATLKLATAADARASTLCGVFGASAVTLEAAALAYLASVHSDPALVVAGIAAAIVFFVAATVAAVAGAPRDFYAAGGYPDDLRNWSWAGNGWRTVGELLDATGQRYALTIRRNAEALEGSARQLKVSLWIGLASPWIGALAFAVARVAG